MSSWAPSGGDGLNATFAVEAPSYDVKELARVRRSLRWLQVRRCRLHAYVRVEGLWMS